MGRAGPPDPWLLLLTAEVWGLGGPSALVPRRFMALSAASRRGWGTGEGPRSPSLLRTLHSLPWDRPAPAAHPLCPLQEGTLTTRKCKPLGTGETEALR